MNGPGGQGGGGLLLGTRLGDFFRVVRYHPIACEHALGPEFRLSAREESGLSSLLDGMKFESESQDVQVVGWFVSHPRGDLRMSGEELQLHVKFFAGGHLALVARPDRLGEMDMAVYYAPEESEAGARLVEPVLSIAPDAAFRPARQPASARRLAPEAPVSVPNSPEITTPDASTAAPVRRNLIVPVLLVLLFVSVCGVIYLSLIHI